MSGTSQLKDDYRLAKCCLPRLGDRIVGFLKADSPMISVHKVGCANLDKVADDRLVALTWIEITKEGVDENLSLDAEYKTLDEIDFKILRHHETMGVDYAAVVAKMQLLARVTVFERHKKLRDLKLLKRVRPKMIQYRKNIVKNKWIKHRNHTYYEITSKGCRFLKYYLDKK